MGSRTKVADKLIPLNLCLILVNFIIKCDSRFSYLFTVLGKSIRFRAATNAGAASKGVGRKFFGRGATEKKQDRKIELLSLSLLYQYHVWKSRWATTPLPPHCWRPWQLEPHQVGMGLTLSRLIVKIAFKTKVNLWLFH